MSSFLLGVVFCCYSGTAITHAFRGNYALGIMYAAYAIAILALISIEKSIK